MPAYYNEKGVFMPVSHFLSLLSSPRPAALANIQGDTVSPVRGFAAFYNISSGGTLIQVEVFQLPDQKKPASSGFFGMHIHDNGNCTPPFDQTGMHYNPTAQEHPFHSGDLPPLLSSHGYAWMVFYDGRFGVSDIIGKSLIIHENRDDFTSQPAGDSGRKIACGVIEVFKG